MPILQPGDLINVLSTFFAALAAMASWAAVWQGRKMWKAGLQPELHAQSLGQFLPDGSRRIDIVIENFGGAAAKAVGFLALGDGDRCFGVVPSGFMGPGDRVKLETALTPPADLVWDMTGVLVCVDLQGHVHAWRWDGKHDRPRTFGRRRRALSLEEAFATFYPEVDTSVMPSRDWRVAQGTP